MPFPSFHITLHVRPADAVETTASVQGETLPAVAVRQAALAAPFSLSFEQVSDRLAALPRMFLEPDGSFVWVSSGPNGAWQLDGVLYDRDGRVLHVEVKGSCPEAEFDRLLAALGWPETPVLVQLTREAVFLGLDAFRRLAGWRP